jgi:hypothetical protein
MRVGREIKSLVLGAALLLVIHGVGGCGYSKRGVNSGAKSAGEQKALEVLDTWQKRQLQVVALCGLARKVEPYFPNRAKECYLKALALAKAGDSARASEVAAALRSQAASRPQGWDKKRLIALARSLESRAFAGWPLRLVAEGALSADPEISEPALKLALDRCRSNPNPEAGELESAAVILVWAKIRPLQAREKAQELKNLQTRARVYRELALLRRDRGDLDRALAAGHRISDAALRLQSLARTAAVMHAMDPDSSLKLLKRIWAEAGQVQTAAPGLQDKVAAILVRVDVEAGLQAASRIPLKDGAGFWALYRAGLGLLGRDSDRARRALVDALGRAEDFSLLSQRLGARCLVIQALASLDPVESRRLLAEISPKVQHPAQAPARAALALALAPRDFAGALKEAKKIPDPRLRLDTLARLAVLGTKAGLKGADDLVNRVWDLARQQVKQGEDMPFALWGLALLSLDSSQVMGLARAQNRPSERAETLLFLARRLLARQKSGQARQALNLALETINSIKSKQILDKVRLLGDMGRGWFSIDAQQSGRIFDLGMETALKIGEQMPVPAS